VLVVAVTQVGLSVSPLSSLRANIVLLQRGIEADAADVDRLLGGAEGKDIPDENRPWLPAGRSCEVAGALGCGQVLLLLLLLLVGVVVALQLVVLLLPEGGEEGRAPRGG